MVAAEDRFAVAASHLRIARPSRYLARTEAPRACGSSS
jgi:hypothetical protein